MLNSYYKNNSCLGNKYAGHSLFFINRKRRCKVPTRKAAIITTAATECKPTIESNLRLPGQYEDQETGLHYNYFRYYDTQTGRYITQDPIGLAGGMNQYVYVSANPTRLIDPTGQCPWCIAGAAIGLAANVGSQLYGNGFNWGALDYKSVILATLAGAASGGLGTFAAGLNMGWGLAANTFGSGIISGVQSVASKWDDVCSPDALSKFTGVWDWSSAFKGAAYGFVGGSFGAGYTTWLNARNANSFLNTSNAVSGPYYPHWTKNWAPGGNVGGNVIGNAIGNAYQ